MAGGSGTRFWPASRNNHPKQLLNLAGEQSMIQDTVARLGDLAPPERVRIITNQRLVDGIAQQLPALPPGAVVGEPCKRDTAPCVGLAAVLVAHDDPEATMVVMPADHVITPDAKFRSALQYAATLLEADPERIITFGIRPTFPAASYGYIERGESIPVNDEPPTFRVRRFREKPSVEVAQEYLDMGNFYWNSGIFVWKAQTVLNALQRFEPEMSAHLQKIGAAIGQPDYEEVLSREFAAISGKSIDYAVMEGYENRLVVEAPFSWDDVGNWSSIMRLQGADEDGNTISGRHVGVNSAGVIVRGDEKHLIATVGMKDCIVVHTPDATLVANRRDEESIRALVKIIEQNGWQEYL